MPELTKAKRINELKSRLMDGARFTVGKMMHEFGITRRTANRDLLDLGDMGLNLMCERLGDGRQQWFVDSASRNIHVTYSIRDVMSLFLGRRMFDFLENTSLEESFNRVYRRVETQLSNPRDLNNANKLVQKVYLVHEGPKKLPKKASEILDVVLSGLLHEKKVKLRYANHRGDESRFTICPYTIVAYKRGLYLLGAVDEYGGNAFTYSLERIKAAEWLKDEPFEYPQKYNPEKFFGAGLFIATGKPEKIELVFTKGTKPFVEFRRFHKSQKLKELADGRLRMAIRVPINFETVNWILSFGSNVKVVSPKSLRDMVREELQKAIKQY